MKNTLGLLAVTVLATGAIASQAYAANPAWPKNQAEINRKHSQQKDNQDSVAGNPDEAKDSKTEVTSGNQNDGHTSISVPRQQKHTGGTGSR